MARVASEDDDGVGGLEVAGANGTCSLFFVNCRVELLLFERAENRFVGWVLTRVEEKDDDEDEERERYAGGQDHCEGEDCVGVSDEDVHSAQTDEQGSVFVAIRTLPVPDVPRDQPNQVTAG